MIWFARGPRYTAGVRNHLTDTTVVIVGGTTGLGLSAAKACLAEGARVLVVGRSAASARAAEIALGDAGRAHVAGLFANLGQQEATP